MFIANGLHVPPIAYKLRSLSDLPGLILQVAGTPTQGVGLLVSDRIAACPYRPFSTANKRIPDFSCEQMLLEAIAVVKSLHKL